MMRKVKSWTVYYLDDRGNVLARDFTDWKKGRKFMRTHNANYMAIRTA